jgi:hypothetical protein
MTPLLTCLDQELAVCPDPLRRAELLAERACYLARTGHFTEAHAIVATLRQTYGDGRNARISVWVMLIEGLLLYFERNSQQAKDRVFRAYTVGNAAGLSRLMSLAGVWLAHMEFEDSNYDSMASILVDAVKSIDPSAHDVQSRLGMVLGDALLFSGERVQSQLWYELSRQHAIEQGDQATLGALMYNRAAFGVALLRASEYSDADFGNQLNLDFVGMELDSAVGFQIGTGVTALTYLVEVCLGRVALLRRQFAKGVETFSRLRVLGDPIENRSHRVSVEVDLAWCLVNCGREADATRVVQEVDIEALEALDIDDRLVSVGTLSRVCRSLNIPSIFSAMEMRVPELRATYISDIERLRNALKRVSSIIAPQ